MEYDSRPKVKLFSFKDEKGETQDLFFESREVMWTLSIVAGLILGGLLFLVDPAVGMITAAVVISGIGFGASYFNQKKEKYFAPLVTSLQEKLAALDISLTLEEVKYLISQKEHRISPKNVLAVWSKDKEMSVFLIEDIKKEKQKAAKAKEFKVELLSEIPAKEKEETVASKTMEASPSEAVKEEESVSGTESPDAEETFEEHEEKLSPSATTDSKMAGSAKVKVTAFASQHASVDAVSTNAIDIVSPPTAEGNTEKPVTAPRTGAIGLIAPGVTGPIPITVGDHSVPYAGVVDSADMSLEPVKESVSSSVLIEAPLRRPRHGRRRATPSNQE